MNGGELLRVEMRYTKCYFPRKNCTTYCSMQPIYTAITTTFPVVSASIEIRSYTEVSKTFNTAFMGAEPGP